MSEHLKGLPACTSCNSAEWQRWLLAVARAVGVPAGREGKELVWGVGNTWETATRLLTCRRMKVIEKRRPSCLGAAGCWETRCLWAQAASLASWWIFVETHYRQPQEAAIAPYKPGHALVKPPYPCGSCGDWLLCVCVLMKLKGRTKQEGDRVFVPCSFLPIPVHRRLHPVSIHTSRQARGTRATGLYLVLAESGLHQPCGFVELPLLGVRQRELG